MTCPFVSKLKSAPYRRHTILLSNPLPPGSIRRWNPFVDKFKQLGIQRPNPNKLIKIHVQKTSEETNENEMPKSADSNYIVDDFKKSYPFSPPAQILSEKKEITSYIQARNPDKKYNRSELGTFLFMYENFYYVKEILKQCLEIYPNRPSEFSVQFGLKITTETQNRFLLVAYRLQYDIAIASHYIVSRLDRQKREPKRPEMLYMSKPEPEKLKNELLILTEDTMPKPLSQDIQETVEDKLDEMDFYLAICQTQIHDKKLKSVTKPINQRDLCSKPIESSSPNEQGFCNIYNSDSKNSGCFDFYPRVETCQFIGLKIKKTHQNQTEFSSKQELLSSTRNKRVISRRFLLSTAEMCFEKKKISNEKSGDTNPFQNTIFNGHEYFTTTTNISVIDSMRTETIDSQNNGNDSDSESTDSFC